jgi:partitioning defective protein 3
LNLSGNDGLGFKLASRDNPTGVANPIYVKTIFPKGAAIEDERLQRGDRLLTVNSIDVTQLSLQETVGLLRETRVGETVELCISRQRDGSLPHDLVRFSKIFFFHQLIFVVKVHDETQITDNPANEIKPQIMTLDIPLNDTSSAGLGITLKGKTSIVDGQSIDLGIFVKSILTGGAASRVSF